jgi:hypothetical protein
MQEKPGSSLSFAERLKKWYQDRQDDAQVIDYVVETVEPKIKDVRGYRQSLRQPLELCLQYCKTMITQIPGPIHLKPPNYYADPLINAAFVGSEKIEDLLASPEARIPEQDPAGSACFALLSMTRKETTTFGPQRQGEMIISDAAMRAVTFTDHKIVGLAATLEASRIKLEQLSLEVIVEAIARDLAAQRSHLSDLRQQSQSLHAMSRMFGGSGQNRSALGQSLEEQEKLVKVQHLMEENENELAAVRERTETPKDWLEILAGNLAAPEKILHMQPVSLRLDWKNVITSNPDEDAHTVTLAQFSLTEELQRDAVIIRYE